MFSNKIPKFSIQANKTISKSKPTYYKRSTSISKKIAWRTAARRKL